MMENPKGKKSTYKYGRRCSRSLGGCISTELCKTIDESLPPAKRLQLLIEYSLKNALTIAQKELGENVDLDKYDDGLSDCLKKTDTELSEKDLYTSAVSGDESVIMQKTLADNVTQTNEAISKLDEECQQWKELVEKERTVNETVSKENSPIIFKGSLDREMHESKEFTEIANSVSEGISNLVENHDYQLGNLESHTTLLQTETGRIRKLIDHLNKEGKKNFSSKIEDTPRTLIKKFCERS